MPLQSVLPRLEDELPPTAESWAVLCQGILKTEVSRR